MTETTSSRVNSTLKRLRWLGLLVLLTTVVGCGGGFGSVTGTVQSKSKGKKVIWGTVTFIGKDGVARPGMITLEGTYKVNGVPVGPAKILVSSEDPRASGGGVKANVSPRQRAGDGTRPPPPGEATETPPEVPEAVKKSWFPISEKYSSPDKTPLSTTVNKGENTYDIILD